MSQSRCGFCKDSPVSLVGGRPVGVEFNVVAPGGGVCCDLK
jgi:hypothetical protein